MPPSSLTESKLRAHDLETDAGSDSKCAASSRSSFEDVVQPQPQEARDSKVYVAFFNGWAYETCSSLGEWSSCSESESPEPSERPSTASMALSDDEGAVEKEDAVAQLVAASKARAPDAAHPSGCTPCLFWPRGVCAAGLDCGYCHLPHALRRARHKGRKAS